MIRSASSRSCCGSTVTTWLEATSRTVTRSGSFPSATTRTSVSLTVKLTPEEREIALHMPNVDVARYVGRYGWITTQVTDEESLENALEWLRESYWLKAPARLRSAVEET